MSVTLPLRLCCMGVTMAPALTQAATQAIKLPDTAPASSNSVSAGRQTGDQASIEDKTSVQTEKLTTKCIKPAGTVGIKSPASHLNGNSLQSVDKQPSVFPKSQGAVGAITVPGQAKGFVIQKGALLQNFVSKNISATSLLCGKVTKSGTMNQLGTAPDKDNGIRGQRAQNRSHTSGELSRVGGSGKVSGGAHQRTSAHLYVQRPQCGNMCPGGSKPAPKAANMSNNFHAGGSVNYRHLKCTDMSKTSDTTSLDPGPERHKVDRIVTEQRDEASRKQAQLERRLEFLQRRLRRLQARQTERHMRQEIQNCVDYHQQNLQTVSKSSSKSSLGCQNSSDLNKELLSDGAKHMSTAALVSLVHKMQKQGSTSQLPVLIRPEVTRVLNMSNEDQKESLVVSDKLLMNLRMMHSALDSDATESSSGGETDGEDGQQDVNHPAPSTPLSRRAEWKWASERAAIASRWTWLQAQVSDLEYRIRQQTDQYRQARSSKGSVVLADPPPPPPQNLSLPRNQMAVCGHERTSVPPSSSAQQGSVAHLQSTSDNRCSDIIIHQSATKCLSAAAGSSVLQPPGYSAHRSHATANNRLTTNVSQKQQQQHANKKEDEDDKKPTDHSASSCTLSVDMDLAADPSCRAARCLPLGYPLRKRKLVRTNELDVKSAKAAKLSTVKCHCHLAMTPCVLCCGKEKSVQTIDPHYMSFEERVALMDPSYHPVLSFSEEVPLSVHFEGLLRSGDWQNKAAVRRPPRAEQGQRAPKVNKLPNLTDGRKALLRKNQSSVIIQSAKIRNKYEHKTVRKVRPAQGLTLANRTLNADLKCFSHVPFSVGRGRGRRRRGQGSRGGYLRRGLDPSALSQDGGAAPKEKEVRRRRGESAYDINSIVIPRSMAALTRVEKLEYKEIPIPRWRELNKASEAEVGAVTPSLPVAKSNGLIAKEADDSDEVEDLSDETYMQRHNICETAEKKRFSSAVRLPHGRRRVRAVMNPRASGDSASQDASQPPTPGAPVSTGMQVAIDIDETGVEESEGRFLEQFAFASSSRPQSPAPFTSLPPSVHPGRTEKEGLTSRASGDNLHRLGLSKRGGGGGGGMTSAHQSDSVYSSGGGVEDFDPGASFSSSSWDLVNNAWPPRQFPLSEEEARQLEREDERIQDEEKACPPTLHHHALPRIPNLRPQPVETGSQAGSSVSSSLPPSPLPSTSSASLAGDWDAGDADWTLDGSSDVIRKKGGSGCGGSSNNTAGQTKIKR
ncbi:uncharacterized protein LOC143276729 [Babylonia areolata]|uniref:uncharacterized protein LOC143276729 n=1 Tax=Babylonia areolata TaxID=304850 RepID=UPI003FD620CE